MFPLLGATNKLLDNQPNLFGVSRQTETRYGRGVECDILWTAMYDGRQQWRHQSESTMAWEEEEETETLREFECVGAGTVQCAVCAYVPSHLKHSRQGSLCLSWDREQSVCGCVLCGCVSVCSISAQTFETGVFMFELSWSKAWGCVAPGPNPSHSVPTLFPYFQAHSFNSPFIRALVLFLFYSYPFPYYYYPLSSSLHS